MKKQRTLEPDLLLLAGTVHPQIILAAQIAAAQLTALGVRHALIGGLAVGAYGVPRATADVDFLVGDEAFVHHASGLVTLAPGVPFAVNGVLVDNLSLPAEAGLSSALAAAQRSEAVPVLPIEALVHTKLLVHRQKDKGDVVELLKAGAPERQIRAYLAMAAPTLLERFEACVDAAVVESGRG